MALKPILKSLTFLLLALSGQAISHPLDSFATDQYVDITMSSSEVSLIHRIEFAEIPTVAEFPKVDTNSDTTLSEEENSQYLRAFERVLSNELVLTSNGQRIVLAYKRGEVLLQEIPAPRLKVITSFQGGLDQVPASGTSFQFDLRHRAEARGDRQIRLLCSGFLKLGSVWSTEAKPPPGMAPPVITEATALVYGHTTKWDLLPSQIKHSPSLANIPSSSRALPLQPPDPFLSLNPRGFEVPSIALGRERPVLEQKSLSVPGTGERTGKDSRSSFSDVSSTRDDSDLSKAAAPEYAEGTSTKPNRETWADSQFRGLFTGNEGGGTGFLLFATLLSLIYGAAHAMEPGHGKTIVAAYLVGSNGTVFHAVLLTLIVTFTHTFSVYILGLIALTNLDKVQGTYLPWLECGSWALIVLMGLVLFLRYYRAYILGDLADPNYHTHGLGHGHSHAPHVYEHHSQDHEREDHHHFEDHHQFEDHHHDDLGHDHQHVHPHDHSPPHDHGHSHLHSHEEDCVRTGEKSRQVSYWNLLTLGITGGIVPCPGALFVMMMALTSGRAAVGLYLITVFSTGLAVALMAVGIVMVRSRRFFDRYSPNSRFVQLLPVLSSIVILLVGTGFLINGLIKHGLLEIHLT